MVYTALVATGINKGVCHLDVTSSLFMHVSYWCFDVAKQYFENILLDLIYYRVF